MGHWQVIECERMDIEYQVPFFLGDYMSMWLYLYPNKKNTFLGTIGWKLSWEWHIRICNLKSVIYLQSITPDRFRNLPEKKYFTTSFPLNWKRVWGLSTDIVGMELISVPFGEGGEGTRLETYPHDQHIVFIPQAFLVSMWGGDKASRQALVQQHFLVIRKARRHGGWRKILLFTCRTILVVSDTLLTPPTISSLDILIVVCIVQCTVMNSIPSWSLLTTYSV